jgi:hypothetical protein
MLGIQPSASHMLGKHPTPELHPAKLSLDHLSAAAKDHYVSKAKCRAPVIFLFWLQPPAPEGTEGPFAIGLHLHLQHPDCVQHIVGLQHSSCEHMEEFPRSSDCRLGLIDLDTGREPPPDMIHL